MRLWNSNVEVEERKRSLVGASGNDYFPMLPGSQLFQVDVD